MNNTVKVLIGAGILYWLWRRGQDEIVDGPVQPLPVSPYDVPGIRVLAPNVLPSPIFTQDATPQVAAAMIAQTQPAQEQRRQVQQEREAQDAMAAVMAEPSGNAPSAVDLLPDAGAKAARKPTDGTATVDGRTLVDAGPQQAPPADILQTEAVGAQKQAPAPSTAPAAPAAAPDSARAQPRETQSVQVTTLVSDDMRLDDADIQRALSPALKQAVDAIPPVNIPFDALSEFAQTVLLRGYAADYVAPKAIDEPGYSAAIRASTQTGLPIGWTQLLIARGVKPDKVQAVAVDLIGNFENLLAKEADLVDKETRAAGMAGGVGVQLAEGGQRPQLNLVRLKGSLMGRFAALPAGAKMGDGSQ